LAYIEAGDFTDANKDLDAAIALNPKYAVAYYLRADAMSKLGDRQAVANLQTAVSLDPSLAKLVQIQGRTVTLRLPLNRG
jgi:Tfp pilus assembly protein PilF